MAGKARRVDFYPDEYIAGVGGVLRADEQGVYWMICSLITSEGGAIENNARRFAGLCIIRPAQVKAIVEKLISIGKLSLQSDGKLSQKRAEIEVGKSLGRIQVAAENGAKGGRSVVKTSSNLHRSVFEVSSNLTQSVVELDPNCNHTLGISQQNQENHEPPGYFAEKLTTNHQPPTTNQDKKQPPSDADKKTPKPQKRATKIPDDFNPDPQPAIDEGLQPQEAIMSLVRFKDHAQANGRTQIDWMASWRLWYRNDIAQKSRGRSSRIQAQQPQLHPVIAEAERRKAQRNAEHDSEQSRTIDHDQRPAEGRGFGSQDFLISALGQVRKP